MSPFKPPAPGATLAGCMWLPRLLYKAAAVDAGELPASYTRSFGNPAAMDGQFLGFFGLSLAEVQAAARLPEADAAAWFAGRVSAARIAEWNALAPNLGRAGYPLHERFLTVAPAIYPEVYHRVSSVFEAIEADEEAL